MKTILKIIFLTMFFVSMVGCTNNDTNTNEVTIKSNICSVEGCENYCVKRTYTYESYCSKHICKADGCGFSKDENSDFCFLHKELQIKMTDAELKQARKVADDYIKQLIEKHSNILAVNIINETPEIGIHNIKYRCNVVREDSDTNLATLYIYITSDGTFKVDKLEYDK